MIAADTNVLVRLLVADDPHQHDAAKAFFAARSAASPAFVSLIVIAEASWVLRQVYRFAAQATSNALLEVIDSAQVVAERPDIARAALADGSSTVADQLIHLIGRDAGCQATVTFDKRFARQPGVDLLG